MPTICDFTGCKKRASFCVGHCVYCDASYCLKHRLPEVHYCKGQAVCNQKSKDTLKNNTAKAIGPGNKGIPMLKK